MRLCLLLALVLTGCRNKDTVEDTSTPVDSVVTVDTQDTSDSAVPQDSDGDGSPDDQDCAPEDPAIFPGAVEVCNGVDDDCDTLVDDDDPDADGEATWWLDADGDGHGSDAYSVEACAAPEGFAASSDDCDDGDARTWPGANEVCDDADNDCDTQVDENADDAGTWYRDADADGYGDPADSVAGCDGQGDTVADATDCDDTRADVNPGQDEVCNGLDDDCDGATDDDDPDIEGQSLWHADSDGDGYGDPGAAALACEVPSQHVADGTDCDDGTADVNPAAAETCDGTDQDCDGLVDDDDPDLAGASTWYIDFDADGYGSASYTVDACEAPAGYVANAEDCDDSSDQASPDGTEVCDGLDNDCSGTVDDDPIDASTWYADSDGDGYGDPSVTSEGCDAPSGTVASARDCDDGDAAVNPAALEVCNGFDDDCNGWVDAGDPGVSGATTWYLDYDGDGFGGSTVTRLECDQPSGYVGNTDDCDDLDGAVHPDGIEVCNGVDDDCDGVSDEPDAADAPTWYADSDADGHGDPGSTDVSCQANSGFVASDDDCDDGDASAYPGAAETCDATSDLDCDGVTSDGCQSCLEILTSGGSSGDGLYDIDPDGTSGSLAEAATWCDMSTDGGGWTLVQRTVWAYSESSQLLTGFTDWAGVSVGDPDAGSAFRYAGEAWDDLMVEGDLLVGHTLRRNSDGASCDPLFYRGSNGTLTVDTAAATASLTGLSSTVTLINDTSLSTLDSGPSANCPSDYDAAPWFYSQCCTTCPTFGGSYWSDEAHPMASYTTGSADVNGQVAADVCGGDDPILGGGYQGVNEMAIYLR